MKCFEVTAAILINDNEILCMQRPYSKYEYIAYKFEFPGGKVESCETYEECLSRELKEEMNLDIKIEKDQFYMSVTHEYPDFKILMHSYLCEIRTRKFKLKEHESFVWLKRDHLMTLDWAPADIPIVHKLMEDTANER